MGEGGNSLLPAITSVFIHAIVPRGGEAVAEAARTRQLSMR